MNIIGNSTSRYCKEENILQLASFIQELELEYNPSNWVLRLPADEAVTKHIEIVTKASDLARKKIPHELNIRYGKGERQLLDIFGTDLPKGSPILLFLHGGYWQMLNKDISSYPAISLSQAGIQCIVGGYDLAPKERLENIIEEVRELAIFVLKLAKKEECKQVWFGGHSAGAHLCASLLEADWFNNLHSDLKNRIRGLVLISGIYDLTPLIHTSVNEALHLDRLAALRLSPMFKLKKIESSNEMTVLLAVGENDSPSFHGQSLSYKKVLGKKNLQARMVEIPGTEMDHFSIMENLQLPSDLLIQEIIKLIK